MNRRALIAFSLLSILLCLISTNVFSGHAQDQDTSVQIAKEGLSSAFLVVSEAEGAGANVSGLIFKLNEAGRLLAEGEIAYRHGKIDESDRKAKSSTSISNNIKSEALNLKELALADAYRILWLNLLYSSLGSIIFVIVLYFVWTRFKHAYTEKRLTMKPEAALDAET